MATTYMNYHHIKSASVRRKMNRTNDCDNTEYGVLELELIDRDGIDHAIVMFYDVPFTEEQLRDPCGL